MLLTCTIIVRIEIIINKRLYVFWSTEGKREEKRRITSKYTQYLSYLYVLHICEYPYYTWKLSWAYCKNFNLV